MPVPDLAGLLRPRRAPDKPVTPDPATPPGPPPADTTEPAAPAARPQLSPAPSHRKPVADRAPREPTKPQTEAAASAETGEAADIAEASRQYVRSIALHLPRELHRRLHEAAVQRGTTATALILTAINATHAQLPTQLAPAATAPRGGQLFDVPQGRRRGEPSVATTIRVTDSQYEVLSRLVEQHRSNRSAIITAALRLYLPLPTG